MSDTQPGQWWLVNAVPEPNSGCWLWLRYVDPLGYGITWNSVTGKHEKAHRAAYRFAYGTIPDGMDVLHRCDVRCCVNPNHLFAGTHTDNMRDMMQKGRKHAPYGEAHHAAKLTARDVLAIRRSREPHKILAARYGVSIHTLHNARYGFTWRNLPQ